MICGFQPSCKWLVSLPTKKKETITLNKKDMKINEKTIPNNNSVSNRPRKG